MNTKDGLFWSEEECLTYLISCFFVIALSSIESKSRHAASSPSTASQKDTGKWKKHGRAAHKSSIHKWALTFFFCPVSSQLAQLLSLSIGKPPSVLFFYPWLKTEKTVSRRQMRKTAGTEWKVSFNLGLGYDLSGLIRAKHYSFHHREGMLIHFQQGCELSCMVIGEICIDMSKFTF